MQGCLDSTSGLIMLPDSQSALVGERLTGAVKQVSVKAEPKVKVTLPVDPSGDGGLMDIVLSPTYGQDRLMYAYVSTPTDNRVIRIADGDVPKPILTGIPKGAAGNMGSLTFTSKTTLLVQTGDAGDPALAADPASLAGKVLRIEQPTTVNQAPITTALSGLGAAGAMCVDASDGSLVRHRPHSERRSAATDHQGFQGVHGVDLAGPARRRRVCRPGGHRAGQSGRLQEDRRGTACARHRRGHR